MPSIGDCVPHSLFCTSDSATYENWGGGGKEVSQSRISWPWVGEKPYHTMCLNGCRNLVRIKTFPDVKTVKGRVVEVRKIGKEKPSWHMVGIRREPAVSCSQQDLAQRVPNSTSSSFWDNFKEPPAERAPGDLSHLSHVLWGFEYLFSISSPALHLEGSHPCSSVVWEWESCPAEGFILHTSDLGTQSGLCWCLGKGTDWTRTQVRVQNARVSGKKALPNPCYNAVISFYRPHPDSGRSHTAQAYHSIREHPPL